MSHLPRRPLSPLKYIKVCHTSCFFPVTSFSLFRSSQTEDRKGCLREHNGSNTYDFMIEIPLPTSSHILTDFMDEPPDPKYKLHDLVY